MAGSAPPTLHQVRSNLGADAWKWGGELGGENGRPPLHRVDAEVLWRLEARQRWMFRVAFHGGGTDRFKYDKGLVVALA